MNVHVSIYICIFVLNKQVETDSELRSFHSTLDQTLAQHKDFTLNIARGFKETQKYMDVSDIHNRIM